MAKIIKAEGKAEKQALDEALKELADLQKMQKVAVKVYGLPIRLLPHCTISDNSTSRRKARRTLPTPRHCATSIRTNSNSSLRARSTSALRRTFGHKRMRVTLPAIKLARLRRCSKRRTARLSG